MQVLLSPRMSMNPRAVKRLRIPHALPPGSTQNKQSSGGLGQGSGYQKG